MPSTTNSTKEFIAKILPQVSRTFAINIRVLKKNEKLEISIAYLLCRILDTIEDDEALLDSVKIKSLTEFPRILVENNNRAKTISTWLRPLKKNTAKPAEKILLNKVSVVLKAFKSLPAKSQLAMLPHIEKMANGMAQFINHYKNNKLKNLSTLSNLLTYCYFVAGTVGELLSAIYLTRNKINGKNLPITNNSKFPALPLAAKKKPQTRNFTENCFFEHAINFGLGLQLTNILKDFNEDKKRGWLYIPKNLIAKQGISPLQFLNKTDSKKNKIIQLEILSEAALRLDGGIAYISGISQSAMRYRLFCLLPLCMAYATLHLLKKQTIAINAPYNHKISKVQLYTIVILCHIACVHPILSKWLTKNMKINL